MKLLDQIRAKLRLLHDAIDTEDGYLRWIDQFIFEVPPQKAEVVNCETRFTPGREHIFKLREGIRIRKGFEFGRDEG